MKKRIWKYTGVSIAIVILLSVVYLFYQSPARRGTVDFNIVYKNDLRLDVYFPTGGFKPKSPVLIYYHGGAWITGQKININAPRISQAINELRNTGFTVISAEYTLAETGKSPFPTCIVDAFDVLRWVTAKADSLNLDTSSIGLMGESAGGHLAMMVGYAPSDSFMSNYYSELQIAKADYVINLFGPSDLSSLYRDEKLSCFLDLIKELPEPIEARINIVEHLFGFDPNSDTAKAQYFMWKYSPISYINSALPPTLIMHGTNDKIVPVSQAEVLHKRLLQEKSQAGLALLPGVDHLFRGAETAQKEQINRQIVAFATTQEINYN